VPFFVPIGETVAEIRRFSIFSKWQPSAILDMLYAFLDHPRRTFGGLCHSAEFGWNRCSSFDNMQVLIFCALDLEVPIYAPKKMFFGEYTPIWKKYQRYPKRHFLARKHVILGTHRLSLKSTHGCEMGAINSDCQCF